MRQLAKPLFLIAEENQQDHFLMKEAFEECGCCQGVDFNFVKDSQEIINFLQRLFVQKKDYSDLKASLLILSLNLARKDGYEVVRKLKAHHAFSTVPIVVLATSLNGEEVEHLYQLGVTSFFIKPSIFGELLDVVTHIYNRARV